MSDDGWSRALMAASGVPVAHARVDDARSALVREARAQDLPRTRILELAQRREAEVREAIGAREDCPLGAQAALAHDRRASVRIALASGAGLAATIATELGGDRDPAVLKALSRNVRTPREVLVRLATHRREDVARLARRALDGGTVATSRDAVPEIEEHRHRTAPADAAALSPVGERRAAVLAPRPSAAPRPPRDVSGT